MAWVEPKKRKVHQIHRVPDSLLRTEIVQYFYKNYILIKEETHSLIHFTSCSDFELDINLRLMMDQRILDFHSWAVMMVANSRQ
jgi:hypothetical protein